MSQPLSANPEPQALETEPVVSVWMRRVEATYYGSTVMEQAVSRTIRIDTSIAIIIFSPD